MTIVPEFSLVRPVESWDELSLLTATILLEAEGEPEDGALGVAYVILNRRTTWALSLHQVILGPEARAYDDARPFEPFSCWNDDYRVRAEARLVTTVDPVWAWRAAAAALWALLPDPTHGATFYLNPELTRRVRPDHDLPSWYDPRKVTARIGRHEFLALG